MSTNQQEKTEQLSQKVYIPSLQKMQESFDLVVTEELEKKIRHMCNRLPTLEWSGTLFYTVEGSFGNKDLKIVCKDMFVMDIGTATYTEFDVSPDVVAYLADNPELVECYMGLIH